ncbi:hypothetical protein VMT65_22430 [Nocardia sp. CDC153]|uniref:hypothetical protein n=1 Tax=Nocardia sp. CDC153 TaxID=3112167 RepID=UPI002DBAF185|nr:hypothetical protein [Nocardia sp. CDC153]MEC3955807.1 hypothetical protein [Nocardia sp. CDC153]
MPDSVMEFGRMSGSKSWLDEDPADGYELSVNQESKYQEYLNKPKPPGEKHKDRLSWLRKNKALSFSSQYGDDFRDGLAITRGWTRDKGWSVEERFETNVGDRFYDAGRRGRDRVGHEAKYGKVGTGRTLGRRGQLAKDEETVKRGGKVHWHVTDMSKVDSKVLAKLQALRKKYPERFSFEEVSEAEKNLSMTIGKQMRPHRYGNGKPMPSYYAAQQKLAETHADTIAKLKRPGPGSTSPDQIDGGKGLVAEVKARTKALKDKNSAVKDDLKAMADHENAHRKVAADVGKSPKSFTDLTKAIKDSSTAQKNAQGATKAWIGAHSKLNASMLKSPAALIVAGIVALIGVVTVIITHWGTVQRAFETVKKTVLDPVGDFFNKVFASATAGFKSVTDGISDAFGSLGDKIGGVFDTVVKRVAVIVAAIGTVLQKLNIPVPDWLGGGSIGLGGIGDVMVGWASKHMATGGPVRGPGGPRDDQVPIMASNGEFVVNAAATARHSALLEAINNDTLQISGRDLQVMAVRSGSFAVPSAALPVAANNHHFDHSTTINLTTHHLGDAHARAQTLAAQREVAASLQ